MKLGAIFGGKPISPPKPEYIFIPILEEAMAKANPEHPYNGEEPVFRASSLGYCLRKQLYKLKGYTEEKTAKEHFTLNLGTVVHEMLQKYIAEYTTIGISSEETIQLEELKYRTGHYDYLVKIAGKKYLLEIKTSNVEAYQRLALRPIPYAKHKRQATFYMKALGVTEAIFLYVNKNGSLLADFAKENPDVHPVFLEVYYKLEEKLHKENVNENNELIEHFRNGTLPPYVAVSECSYCPASIKDQCKKDRKIERKNAK